MSRLAIGYEIGRFTGTCAATGALLPPDTPCVATLSESAETPGFARRDYSIEAWDAGHRPAGLFSYWRTVVPHPDAPRRLLVDDQTLLDIFLRMDADDRPERRAFRFVLALILMRRRMLRSVGRDRVMLDPGHSGAGREAGPEAGRETDRETGPETGPEDGREERRGHDVWLLQPRGAVEGAAPIRVIDPRLDESDLAAIAEQLGEVIAGDA
ncbi:MAG: hypothetical protein U0575_08235 [Phycisphaerales bacterium]